MFNVFFTGHESQLFNAVIIGDDSAAARFYHFEFSAARASLYSNNTTKIASLQFSPGNQLGTATIQARTLPMRDLLAAGTSSAARAFYSPDGSKKYEWRRVSDGYDLYALSPPTCRIAAFRRCGREVTSVGECWAVLQYTFSAETLLVYSLVTLSLNRWLDNA